MIIKVPISYLIAYKVMDFFYSFANIKCFYVSVEKIRGNVDLFRHGSS